jgi:hypothetical protein
VGLSQREARVPARLGRHTAARHAPPASSTSDLPLQESKIHQTTKHIFVVLRKKEQKLEYWPRLSKDKARLHNVKVRVA